MDIFIRERSFIAKIAAFILKEKRMAVTINNTICLHNCTRENFMKDKRWLAHEIAHVLQYKKIGTLRFIILYLRESLLKGYKNNRFEIEARAREEDSGLLSNMRFV